MALQTLDPLALSATKLQAGGMDAQEVAYKRKAMEDDLAKTQLAVAAKDRETAQKQKEADQKLALMPTYDTLSQQHTKFAFEWMAKEMRDADIANDIDVPDLQTYVNLIKSNPTQYKF